MQLKITLLVTSFNGLAQAVYCKLLELNHKVDVVYAGSLTKLDEINSFKPNIILCPFLKHFIPKEIYENYPTFVFHPGVKGDRGAHSIEWALWEEKEIWGGVWLKANSIYDGGDIYAKDQFRLRDSCKSSIYRIEEKNIAVDLIDTLLYNIIDEKKEPQILNPIRNKIDLTIEWENDTTQTVIKKINCMDSFPGVLDQILGIKCYLFGAFLEDKIKGDKPKTVLAKRDGAICLATIDGAVWITHLKEPDRFKLPSTYVLKDRLKGIKEDRIPLIFDRSYNTFYEISCDKKDEVAYLRFNFLNGAFRVEQCMRLKYAIEYLKDKVKVIVLKGGDDFFSNGINLNILEDSKKSGEDGWSNINGINDLVHSIIFTSDCITVASIESNCGAGGVFLATACDFVVAKKNVVLNPHYKTLGLNGSEYHTYSLPKRVGQTKAQQLLDECLPIGVNEAFKIGLVDKVFSDNYKQNLENFTQELIKNSDKYDDFLWDKEDYLEENRDMIEQCKENEIAVMYNQFWDSDSIFHKLRYDFVYKVCTTSTPKRLKYKG